MPSKNESTMAQPQSAKKPEDMSLDELTAVLEQEIAAAEKMVASPAEAAPAQQPAPEGAPPAEAEPAAPQVGGLSPAMIQEATSLLVQMGIIEAASAELTPELMATLQALADTYAPGLFDLQQPDQMEEFLDGIINGTIELAAPAAPPAAVPGAVPAAVPGAVPAAVPGAVPAAVPGLVPGPIPGDGTIPAAGAPIL